MTRLLIHAGFHKTGTGSVQHGLRRNAAALVPHLRVALKPDFEALSEAARAHSVDPGATPVGAVAEAAAGFFATLDRDDPRPVLLSSEDLCGTLPGRRGLRDYDAARRLLPAILGAARARFGEGLRAEIVLVTRAAEPWVRSVWWQTLRSTRLTEGFEAFRAALTAASDLNRQADHIAAAVAPIPVRVAALEDHAERRLGPLAPVLAAADLPPPVMEGLSPPQRRNAQPAEGMAEVLLALNRSGLPPAALGAAKRSVLEIARLPARRA